MSDFLGELKTKLDARIPGLTRHDDDLQAKRDARWGHLTLDVAFDPSVETLRCSVAIPPPVGGGAPFLVWCLSTTAQYWDVKIGLDDTGLLLVHADVDAPAGGDLDEIAETVANRLDTILELIDDDLASYLLEQGLGTPAQLERWRSRESTAPGSE